MTGLGCAALVFCWQLLTVHFNYENHWNGLFCTGDRLPVPQQLASEHVYEFPKSYGYDGEYYHYIAHDPFFQRGFARYIDAPRFRYRRILIPITAFLLALGRSDRIDAAYIGVVLLHVFLGGWWLSRYCSRAGLSADWGFGFVLLPATLVSIDRMTVDVALAALCAGFAVYVTQGSRWALYGVLAAAPLVRDTGFLLVAAYILYLLWVRKLGDALLYSTMALPALSWYLFVQLHTVPYGTGLFTVLPWKGLIERVLHPVAYPLAPLVAGVATLLDYAALAGITLAIALAIRMALQRLTGPIEFNIYVFALMVTFVSAREAWLDAYAFARGFTPLLLFLALIAASNRRWIYAAPLLLAIPRIALQLTPQALRIVTSWL
jgi:hypothetical protein